MTRSSLRSTPGSTLPRRRALGTLTRFSAATLAAALLGLSGCAGVRSLDVEVSSYGDWPSARKPGSYAFERLPSQQSRAEEASLLEAAARPALAKAGFVPAVAGQEPDVLVQVGSRVGRADYSPWDDPLWWRGSHGFHRPGLWVGRRWVLGSQFDFARYDHQVALLLRDRSSGKPVFETRASRESGSSLSSTTTVSAMFEAALMDFPKLGLNPRNVSIVLPP